MSRMTEKRFKEIREKANWAPLHRMSSYDLIVELEASWAEIAELKFKLEKATLLNDKFLTDATDLRTKLTEARKLIEGLATNDDLACPICNDVLGRHKPHCEIGKFLAGSSLISEEGEKP